MSESDAPGAGQPAPMQHRRENTIVDPGLNDRGNVFFAAVEMTRMPMVLTDPNLPDNPIVFANKAFLDLTLYEEEELLGRNCRFLQGARTDPESVAELRRGVAARESIAIELLNYKRDGTPFWNAVFIGPVHDVTGKLLYFFASQLDVTRRRDAEVNNRQAQKMEAIGQLTAGLAHDFNNLLQVMDGNLELLDARIEDARLRHHVERARAAAERGAKLTKQLLAFARKARLEPRQVDLTELVTGFADMIETSLGKQVQLHLSLRRGLPATLLDIQQFEMALLNIVGNAREAMPGGGVVTIETSVRSVTDVPGQPLLPRGDYVSVEVRDQGEGMSPDVAARAAEPFFTTKSVGKGTGLGLAMASGFAQQSRGAMEIESKPGGGTTIRFLFPTCSGTPSTTAASARGAALDPETVSRDGGGAHILIVEDSPEVLELAAGILGSVGYHITTATNGEEGLKAYEAAGVDRPIDLLFTDLVMPGGMNGVVLANEIRRRDPELPVLMTTGYNEELVADGPRRPSSDVIGKPYRRAELLDRVRHALSRPAMPGARRHGSDFGAAEA